MTLFAVQLQALAATAPMWSPPVVTLAAVLWVWWVRHGIDRSQKVHCRQCDYRGHPRIRVFPVRGALSTCPDCGGESLIPVHSRGWLHHQQASPLTAALNQASRHEPEHLSS